MRVEHWSWWKRWNYLRRARKAVTAPEDPLWWMDPEARRFLLWYTWVGRIGFPIIFAYLIARLAYDFSALRQS